MHRYDACDVGTFPNVTLPDGSGPAAANFSTAYSTKYSNALSWLPGQKLPGVSSLLSASFCPIGLLAVHARVPARIIQGHQIIKAGALNSQQRPCRDVYEPVK